MSEQHATLLKKAFERLVEDRRAFAKILALMHPGMTIWEMSAEP